MKPDMVGITAEFSVACELGRRDIYAQPTFGHLKRTDLLVCGENERPIRIEVKGKQSYSWPNCKGISDYDSILVLVDFAGKTDVERPDYYMLTVDDWLDYVNKQIKKWPGKKIELDNKNVPIWTTEVRNGKPYKGMGVEVKDIFQHKEAWNKITDALKKRMKNSYS